MIPSVQNIFLKLADNNNTDSLSHKYRKQRFQIFLKLLNVSKEDAILDVGGTESIWIGTGFESNVTLLNLKYSSKLHPFNYVICNACDMSIFKDKEFDVVYSNSVIEHVGGYDFQKLFAKEVQRVSKKYWIQTPYKHFPIEPHFLFPLFQYLPPQIQRQIGMKWSYSHLKRNGEDILDELTRLRLINLSDMNKLFPHSNIINEKYFGIIKSIIAYKQ